MPIFSTKSQAAKIKKVYVGNLLCTTYHVSDNTPRGSRETATGERATEYHTIAVDVYNPLFPMGTELYIEGFGYGVVEDTGGFGKYGVDLDLFTAESDGYKKRCKVWIYRPETLREKKERLAKIRKRRQRGTYRIILSTEVAPGVCIVDPGYIKRGSTVVYPGGIVEADRTDKTLGSTIIVGCNDPIFQPKMEASEFFDTEKLRVHLDVYENANG